MDYLVLAHFGLTLARCVTVETGSEGINFRLFLPMAQIPGQSDLKIGIAPNPPNLVFVSRV